MNELKIFDSPRFGAIRTITANGKTLFCGVDVARALGYVKPQDAINRHCRYSVKHGVGVQTGTKADGTPAIKQVEMIFIPEGNLCRLAAKSELPGADEFERWIFDEVIPAILRTGSYTIPGRQAPARLNLPEGVSLSGLAKLIIATRTVMLDMGSSATEIGAVVMDLYDACGIPLNEAFSKQLPGQTSLFDHPALEG